MEILKGLKPTDKTIVFIGKKIDCDRIADKLWNEGVKCDSIHGDKDQYQRTRVLGQFKSSMINLLFATDVAARGLDVKDITHVINYDMPGALEDYVHRIGRTGRAGATGTAHSFFTSANANMARELTALVSDAGQEVPRELQD